MSDSEKTTESTKQLAAIPVPNVPPLSSQSARSSIPFGLSRRDLWPLAMIVGFWFLVCHPLLFGWQVVAFRDSGHLYYPMFKAIDVAWQNGQTPLMNPYCDFGYPLIADGTSSVFYPGKLIFLLRFLSFPARYGIYLASHILLAALGSYFLARSLKCHRSGAIIAALSFAFGAPVLFQATNVIYLVSAGWLPFAMIAIWQLLQRGSISWTLFGSVCCTMMILGGDPQMTYHVGLMTLLSIVTIGAVQLINWFRKTSSTENQLARSWYASRIGCLVLLTVVTFLLSAIQVLPTAKLASQSERSPRGKIVNIFTATPYLFTGDVESVSSALVTNAESQMIGQYQFSQPPWSLIETVLPNFNGRPFPIHTQWSAKIAANDRMWYPSLYLGLATIVLAISGMRFFSGCVRSRWLTWIAILFVTGCWGWYGLGWLINEFLLLTGVQNGSGISAPVGGTYWWMSVLLPQYFSFRYPAKLFVIASLCLSMLAGMELSRLKLWRPKTLLIGSLLLFAGGVLGIEYVFRPFADHLLSAEATLIEPVEFGPFQPGLACQQMYATVIHAGLTLMALSAVVWFQQKPKRIAKIAMWSLPLVLACDLYFANTWILGTVPSSVFESQLEDTERGISAIAFANSDKPFAFFANPELPSQFFTESSTNRLAELVQWDRLSLRAKHHLPEQKRLIGSFHSIVTEGYPATRTIEDFESVFLSQVTDGSFDWNRATFDVTFEPNSEIVEQASSHSDVGHRLVHLPIIWDDAWRVEVSPADGPSDDSKVALQLSENDLGFVCIALLPGEWRVELTYYPVEFYVGLWISIMAWLALTVGLAFVFWKRT